MCVLTLTTETDELKMMCSLFREAVSQPPICPLWGYLMSKRGYIETNSTGDFVVKYISDLKNVLNLMAIIIIWSIQTTNEKIMILTFALLNFDFLGCENFELRNWFNTLYLWLWLSGQCELLICKAVINYHLFNWRHKL